MQAYLILLYLALLRFTDVAFLKKIEGKTLRQQKNLTHFIGVVWNRTLNISEICLYMQTTF